mgnify:CR=1 FL=1
MKELQGSHMRKNRNSRTLECAARWLAERGSEASARTIFENMEFKNGKPYKNYKKGMSSMQFLMRMRTHPCFKVRRGNPNMYSCTMENYNRYWADKGRFYL